MVNNKIVSKHQGNGSPWTLKSRKIMGNGLYPKIDVIDLFNIYSESSVVTVTKKCASDVKKLSFDPADIGRLVKNALNTGRFLGSEWCQTDGGAWAACDAYSISRFELCEAIGEDREYDYYIKFAIGRTGKLLLMASCHLSEFRI